MLAKSKLNSIETLISLALIDLGISHKEFKTIVNEQDERRHWNDEKSPWIKQKRQNNRNMSNNTRNA